MGTRRSRGAAGGRKRRAPRRWARIGSALFKLALVLGVLGAGGLIYLHVTLTEAFEGGLWKLPSRVYSDALRVEPGARLSADELAGRLDRAGYARVRGAPRRPGQYSAAVSSVDVHLRPFATGGSPAAARRVTFVFDGESVRTIRDARGRRSARAVVEPELIATLYGSRREDRVPVGFDAVPEPLKRAVLAAEDARFFEHSGLDLRGIARAAWANVRHGRIVQGGSTITQQTVKNLFLGEERTWLRKSREAVMSLMLEARYPKERILEVYLNEVYLGQRGSVAICGVQAAARFYFGRDVAELSLGESAMLAGLIRNPGGHNPFVHPASALGRRDQILDTMERLGLAEPGEIEAARKEPLGLASGRGGFTGAAYAVDYVRSQLSELYSPEILEREGLSIYTTIDTRWQQAAERALDEGLSRLEREVPALRKKQGDRRLQGAVLVTEPRTGAIRALVGGRDYAASQFNRAVQARRQPGSCFKPFVYAAGLEPPGGDGQPELTLASLLDDGPLAVQSGGREWRPENYDHQFRGTVTVRRALEESLNVPTVRAARRIGLDRVVLTARACGIDSPLQELPSLALGAAEVTPLELATAYGTLARSGERRDPWIVSEVADSDGRPLARAQASARSAISPQAAFLVEDALRGVFERGTAKSAAELGFRGEAAGKTGTTDDTRDAWFVGYTAEALALVWVGYDDNERTTLTGATGALPIWVDLMTRGPAAVEAAFDREPPWGLVSRRIDPETGGLMLRGCPEWRDEWFVRGTEPTRPCSEHRGGLLRRWFRSIPPRTSL